MSQNVKNEWDGIAINWLHMNVIVMDWLAGSFVWVCANFAHDLLLTMFLTLAKLKIWQNRSEPNDIRGFTITTTMNVVVASRIRAYTQQMLLRWHRSRSTKLTEIMWCRCSSYTSENEFRNIFQIISNTNGIIKVRNALCHIDKYWPVSM